MISKSNEYINTYLRNTNIARNYTLAMNTSHNDSNNKSRVLAFSVYLRGMAGSSQLLVCILNSNKYWFSKGTGAVRTNTEEATANHASAGTSGQQQNSTNTLGAAAQGASTSAQESNTVPPTSPFQNFNLPQGVYNAGFSTYNPSQHPAYSLNIPPMPFIPLGKSWI